MVTKYYDQNKRMFQHSSVQNLRMVNYNIQSCYLTIEITYVSNKTAKMNI